MGKVIEEKSFEFSVEVIKKAGTIKADAQRYGMTSQLVRSATSIGANISEAKYAQSGKDFLSKHKIALKEANEAIYWLRLLGAVQMMEENTVCELLAQAEELIRIITAIIRTTSKKIDG